MGILTARDIGLALYTRLEQDNWDTIDPAWFNPDFTGDVEDEKAAHKLQTYLVEITSAPVTVWVVNESTTYGDTTTVHTTLDAARSYAADLVLAWARKCDCVTEGRDGTYTFWELARGGTTPVACKDKYALYDKALHSDQFIDSNYRLSIEEVSD